MSQIIILDAIYRKQRNKKKTILEIQPGKKKNCSLKLHSFHRWIIMKNILKFSENINFLK